MKLFGTILAGLVGAAVLGTSLVGCGGSTIDPSGDQSYVRAIHLASNVGAVDVLAGGATLTGNLSPLASFPAAGEPFAAVDRGETTVIVRPTGTTTNAIQGTIDLSGGDLVSIVAAGAGEVTPGGDDSYRLIRIADDASELDRSRANLRVLHAAIGVGNVDVYLVPGSAEAVTGTPVLTNVARYQVSALQAVAPGSYTIFVTPTGTTEAAIRREVTLTAGYFVVAAENTDGAALRVYGTAELP